MASVQDIVEGLYLESQSIDSIIRNKERYLMYKHAKDGLKRLNLTFGQNLKGMNFIVPASCKAFKPSDFQKFVRAYLINCDGKKIEIKRSTDIPEGIFKYLVDCEGSILEDCDESSLYDECLVCNNTPPSDGAEDCDCCHGSGYLMPSGLYTLINDLEKYKDSWIAERNDYFEFSADLEEQAIVIEYIGNQTGDLTECQLIVKDDYEDALRYFIMYRLLEVGEQTLNQAMYYKKQYKNAKDAIMSQENALTVDDLKRIMILR